MIEFMLVKLGLLAVFQFFHGLVWTYVTGLPLEQEEIAESKAGSEASRHE